MDYTFKIIYIYPKINDLMIFIYLKFIVYIVQMIYPGIVWNVATIQILMKNKVTCPTLTGKTLWILISIDELCMQRPNGAH